MVFDEKHVNEYKETLVNSFTMYELITTILSQKLDNYLLLNTNNSILRYIGYIYEYVLIEDMFMSILRNKDLLDMFISNQLMILSTLDKKNIMDAYLTAKTNVNNLISHDLETIPRFPCLLHLELICESGKVDASELYVSILLRALFRENPVIVKTIKQCIAQIMDQSTYSDELQFHYSCLLDELTRFSMSGGRMKTNIEPTLRKTLYDKKPEFSELGNLYLSYLSLYSSNPFKDTIKFPHGLNSISIGSYTLNTNFDFTFIKQCMTTLTKTHSILIHEFENLLQSISKND